MAPRTVVDYPYASVASLDVRIYFYEYDTSEYGDDNITNTCKGKRLSITRDTLDGSFKYECDFKGIVGFKNITDKISPDEKNRLNLQFNERIDTAIAIARNLADFLKKDPNV